MNLSKKILSNTKVWIITSKSQIDSSGEPKATKVEPGYPRRVGVFGQPIVAIKQLRFLGQRLKGMLTTAPERQKLLRFI